MHSKSYISLHKLYKLKKKKVRSKKKKKTTTTTTTKQCYEINWNTTVGCFACACVHPLSDNSVGASDLMVGNEKLE